MIAEEATEPNMFFEKSLGRIRSKNSSRRRILSVFIGSTVVTCNGFQIGPLPSRHCKIGSRETMDRGTSLHMVATEPSRGDIQKLKMPGVGRSNGSSYPSRDNTRQRRQKQSRDDAPGRWSRAVQIEAQLITSLESMRDALQNNSTASAVEFPPVRDCNAALATFGDGGDLLRALRLFVKMRKAASLARSSSFRIPAPTLVTYSTLMSRAVRTGKARVALRLWRLMTMQAEFFTNSPECKPQNRIVPDVKAANILMNAYAKLADYKSAQDLLRQMLEGSGTDVPRMTPNLVTYNTLLDACHKAGELDHALAAKEQLDENGLIPDAWTYTSLIACVARKASAASGAHDPTMAFMLLQDMTSRNIRPNGMTYCALIDVCGRCRRSDLALKGLRMMLRQKRKEVSSRKYALDNEVGAWTAAINACGKAGRLETAVRLFYAMPNFGVKPNTITCGCLTDCLLKGGRTADTLDVLRYMKRESIAPSEVMYTSLMTSAGRLVEAENKKQWEYERTRRRQKEKNNDDEHDEQGQDDEEVSVDPSGTKAIEVYTELMTSLMRGTAEQGKANSKIYKNTQGSNNKRASFGQRNKVEDSNTLLVKVFLVFQEMKAAGAQPDLACYNALMRACARAGDVNKAQEVLDRIQADGLDPNDTTWREMIRAAGKARRSDIADATWKAALQYRRSDEEPYQWQPSVTSFGALVSAYLRHASSLDSKTDYKKKSSLYSKVVAMYASIITGKGQQYQVDMAKLHDSERTMLMILRAVVAVEQMYALKGDLNKMAALRKLGKSIVLLECFRGIAPNLRDNSSLNALHRARMWLSGP